MRRILFLIAFLSIALVISAQRNCFFTHYSSEDGLSQNTVMSILQDHKGNLWFSTWDGINRFNGYSFKTYKARQGNFISLTNNRVDRMYEDPDGFLWLLTYDNRAHRFDPRTETFEQVPAAGQLGSNSNVNAISVLRRGTVWLLTENDGAIRVTASAQTGRLATEIYSAKSGLFPATKVFKVYQDADNNEWLLTDNGLGLIRPGEKTPVSYFVETKERFSDPKQAFYAVQENETEICFGSDRGRVWRYQKENGQFELLELPTRSRISSINSVEPDKVVIATSTDGFFVYNLKTKEYVHYSHVTCRDLPSAPIVSAYVDKTSEVWFEQEEPGVVAHFNPFTGILKREQIRVDPTAADRSHLRVYEKKDVNGRQQ